MQGQGCVHSLCGELGVEVEAAGAAAAGRRGMVPEARTKPALRGWEGARSTLKLSLWSASTAAFACICIRS